MPLLTYWKLELYPTYPYLLTGMNHQVPEGPHSLVGALEHFLFFDRLGRIIPTDFHIFQRGGPTTNQFLLHPYQKPLLCVAYIPIRPWHPVSGSDLWSQAQFIALSQMGIHQAQRGDTRCRMGWGLSEAFRGYPVTLWSFNSLLWYRWSIYRWCPCQTWWFSIANC